mgnify:CR=1 FL=1
MKKKLWAVLVAFVALTVFATSAFAAVRWRNVASIYPGISAGDNSYTPKLIAPLFFMKKGYSEHILKFLVLPPPIMDTHMSFLVQPISNPVPLTS